MRRIASHIITLTVVASLTGCYNATRTATISSREVKREGAALLSADQMLLASVAPTPPAQWNSGTRWHITDDRLRLMLSGDVPSSSISGSDMTFVAFDSVPSLMGNQQSIIRLNIAGHDVVYRLDESPAATQARHELKLPMTVSLDIVDAVAARLQGKKVYPLTSTWIDAEGNYTQGRRYMPATVVAVEPGTPQAPVALIIVPDYDRQVRASVLMTLTPEGTGARDFASLFSTSDPRNRYQDIYPDVWELITLGKVRPGMTRRECRLALGAPVEIKTREYYGFTREIWSYGNGTFLQFDDGLLCESKP